MGTTTATGTATGNLSITTGTLVANLQGNVTGNVTGNASGTAATVTGAAQTAITSVGTLTGLSVSGKVGIGTTSPYTKLQMQGGPLFFNNSIYHGSATAGNGVDSGFIAFGGMGSGGYIQYGMYMGLRKTEAVASASSVRLQIGQLSTYDTNESTSHAN